jgi:hypothetical protein
LGVQGGEGFLLPDLDSTTARSKTEASMEVPEASVSHILLDSSEKRPVIQVMT